MSDEERFQTLFRAVYDDLLCFVERRIHPVVAEDVVAEVFLVAWRRLQDVPTERDQARAWLFGVAHRTLANQRRGDNRRQQLASRIGNVLPLTASDPDQSEQVISQVDLARAWSLLSPADQEVLTLNAMDGLTGAQTAMVLDISTTAVSVRLMRARRRLRLHLNRPARRTRNLKSTTSTTGGTP